MSWKHDATTGAVSVHVEQSAKSGKYALSLPVVVTDVAGVTETLVVNVPAALDAVIVLPRKYRTRPRAVVIDPDARLLARIARS